MNNFNLNLFKYFYYVVFFNGFSNASRNLNVAQSALSYNVKQLENQLNKCLIDRNNKNFTLTDDGNNLYESIKSMFENLDRSLEQYNIIKEELIVGVRHYLSDFIFRDSIKNFIKNFPNIHLVLKLYSRLDIKKFDDDYDILIDYDDYAGMIESENKTKLCTLKNILVAGNELAKSFEEIKTLKDMENVDFISMCPNKKNGKIQKMCFDSGMLFNNIISINNSMLCKKLIKENIGLCLIDKDAIAEDLASGDIKEIKIKEKIFDDNVIIVYKRNNNINNINKFIDEIKKVYKENEDE